MKKILSLTLSLLLTLASFAEPVSKQQALKVAQNVLGAKSLSLLNPETKAADAPYYIFNSPSGGFVIVSGDDTCTPVLGYSRTGTFRLDGMPENLSDWLSLVENEVGEARLRGLRQQKREALAWEQALSPRTKGDDDPFAPAVKHETALWGQNEPFNDLAPTISGSKAVAGCGAVSMAIVMKNYAYPEKGSGTLPSYSYTTSSGSTRTQPGHELGHSYDWESMKMDYSGSYSEEEALAVAQLIYDVGVMSQAEFGKSTSTVVRDIIDGVVRYMGYDAGAVCYRKAFFSDDEWTRMLKEELARGPLVYNGHSENGGHAFVVDGYDESGHFSINWGWTGTDNGYFAINHLKPAGGHDYTESHTAIFGLMPDKGGSETEFLYLTTGTTSAGVQYIGLESDREILAGEDFLLKIGGVCNGGTISFSGNVVAALSDSEGRIRETVCEPVYIENLSAGYWRGLSDVECHLTLFPEEGDCLRAYYMSDNEDVWHPFYFDSEKGTVGAIPLYDTRTLEDVTSFSYDLGTGIASIQTKSNVEWSVTGSAGLDAAAGAKFDTVTITLDGGALKADTYTVTIRKGEDSMKFNVKMGTAK